MSSKKDVAVAHYITSKYGELSAMKLQKLMYYAQAWNLVWEEGSLFDDEFEAWANGPVLPQIYDLHRGKFKVDSSLFKVGSDESLTQVQRDNIDKVLSFYGEKTAQWLSNLTHQEEPWLQARGKIPVGKPSSKKITLSSMHEYYSALQIDVFNKGANGKEEQKTPGKTRQEEQKTPDKTRQEE